MNLRFALIGAAILSSGAVFAAEPPKVPVEQAAQAQPGNPPLVLASADEVRAPGVAGQQLPTPVKHRVARVTTCRCGDPSATEPDAQPEQ